MKKAYIIGLIRLLGVIFQVLYIKTYTHYLTISELGQYFYLFALSYSVNALILVPIDFYQQSKCINFLNKGLPIKALLQVNLFAIILSFVFLSIMSIIILIWSKLSILNFVEMYLLAIMTFLCLSQRNFLNNLNRGVFVVTILLFETIGKIIFFILANRYINNHIHALLFSAILTCTVELMIIFLYCYIIRCYSWVNNLVVDKKLIVKSILPMSFSAICNWFQLQFYRVLYPWMGLSSVPGIYATVSNIGIAGTNAASLVYSQLYLPKVYISNGKEINSYIKRYLIMLLGIIFITLICAPLIVRILTKAELVTYSYLMLFGVLTEAGNTIIGAITAFLTIKNQEKLLFKGNLIGAASCGCGFILIALMHLWASSFLLAYSIVISQILVCLFLYIEVYKIMKK